MGIAWWSIAQEVVAGGGRRRMEEVLVESASLEGLLHKININYIYTVIIIIRCAIQ